MLLQVRMLLVVLVCLGLAAGQEVTEETLSNINVPTEGLALRYHVNLCLHSPLISKSSNAFRCGLFFPDPKDPTADRSAM